MGNNKLEKESILENIRELWVCLAKKTQYTFVGLAALMFISSIAEVISIGAIIPFLGILINVESIHKYGFINNYLDFFKNNSPLNTTEVFSIIFIAITIIGSILKILSNWLNVKFSYRVGGELGIEIYKNTLYKPYSIHLELKSSEIIDSVTRKTNYLISVVNSLMVIISTLLILLITALVIMISEYRFSIFVFIFFGLIYLGLIAFTKRLIFTNSGVIFAESTKIIKLLQESLGSIREIIIDGSQNYYCRMYFGSDKPLRIAQSKNQFISLSPKYFIEMTGILIIALSCVFIIRVNGEIQSSIPILGALALAAQRLLPQMQQMYGAYISIMGNQKSFSECLQLLKNTPFIPVIGNDWEAMKFTKNITLKSVEFKHLNYDRFTLRGADLIIGKGEIIGLIGATGVGKSTLFDIIMGLLYPTNGAMLVDGVIVDKSNSHKWQKNISHVPQTIYLIDGTIAENIAFGKNLGPLDMEKIIEYAKSAEIHDEINEMPSKYQTMVGERGAKLSGGQRQRIGIARALYKEAQVLILDEATSALDCDTESKIMRSIEAMAPKKTILMISHRHSSLANCSLVYELKSNGSLKVAKI